MTSIIKAVLEATIGLLLNKGRDWAAKKLKEGDLTDEKFRSLIVREIDDIKSKLDGLSRKDLLASISFFKEGISILYEVFEKENRKGNWTARAAQATAGGTGEENLEVNLASSATGGVKTVSLAKELSNMRLADLDEFTREALSGAKRRFEDARRKATEAFGNEALNASDRILAMVLRVMGTILEKVDNPANALAACRVCLEELHALPVVQKCFKVEITKDIKGFRSWLKSWFKNNEREEIVAAVCHMNRVIHDVMQMLNPDNNGLLIWPCVDVGTEKLDPLRDARVTQFAGDCFPVLWPFGQEGAQQYKLSACCICTNKKGQFFVGSRGNIVQVLDCSGSFLHFFSCPGEDGNKSFGIEDIATDQDDNVYLLVTMQSEVRAPWCRRVNVFDKDGNFQYGFDLEDCFKAIAMTVEESSRRVFILGYFWRPDSPNRRRVPAVAVFETNGTFVHRFGEDILSRKFGHNITGGNNGHIMVLADFCVHVFTVFGDHLYQFTVATERSPSSYKYNHSLHWANEYVIYVLRIYEPDSEFFVSIYTKDGELVYRFHLDFPRAHLVGITVTSKGRIAILVNLDRDDSGDDDEGVRNGEILVL